MIIYVTNTILFASIFTIFLFNGLPNSSIALPDCYTLRCITAQKPLASNNTRLILVKTRHHVHRTVRIW